MALELEVESAGRYDNVFLGDTLILSYDGRSGELCVYNPRTGAEEPIHVAQTHN
jgi:hypothetical protein